METTGEGTYLTETGGGLDRIVSVTLGSTTGRLISLVFPADITDEEVIQAKQMLRTMIDAAKTAAS